MVGNGVLVGGPGVLVRAGADVAVGWGGGDDVMVGEPVGSIIPPTIGVSVGTTTTYVTAGDTVAAPTSPLVSSPVPVGGSVGTRAALPGSIWERANAPMPIAPSSSAIPSTPARKGKARPPPSPMAGEVEVGAPCSSASKSRKLGASSGSTTGTDPVSPSGVGMVPALSSSSGTEGGDGGRSTTAG